MNELNEGCTRGKSSGREVATQRETKYCTMLSRLPDRPIMELSSTFILLSSSTKG